MVCPSPSNANFLLVPPASSLVPGRVALPSSLPLHRSVLPPPTLQGPPPRRPSLRLARAPASHLAAPAATQTWLLTTAHHAASVAQAIWAWVQAVGSNLAAYVLSLTTRAWQSATTIHAATAAQAVWTWLKAVGSNVTAFVLSLATRAWQSTTATGAAVWTWLQAADSHLTASLLSMSPLLKASVALVATLVVVGALRGPRRSRQPDSDTQPLLPEAVAPLALAAHKDDDVLPPYYVPPEERERRFAQLRAEREALEELEWRHAAQMAEERRMAALLRRLHTEHLQVHALTAQIPAAMRRLDATQEEVDYLAKIRRVGKEVEQLTARQRRLESMMAHETFMIPPPPPPEPVLVLQREDEFTFYYDRYRLPPPPPPPTLQSQLEIAMNQAVEQVVEQLTSRRGLLGLGAAAAAAFFFGKIPPGPDPTPPPAAPAPTPQRRPPPRTVTREELAYRHESHVHRPTGHGDVQFSRPFKPPMELRPAGQPATPAGAATPRR